MLSGKWVESSIQACPYNSEAGWRGLSELLGTSKDGTVLAAAEGRGMPSPIRTPRKIKGYKQLRHENQMAQCRQDHDASKLMTCRLLLPRPLEGSKK